MPHCARCDRHATAERHPPAAEALETRRSASCSGDQGAESHGSAKTEPPVGHQARAASGHRPRQPAVEFDGGWRLRRRRNIRRSASMVESLDSSSGLQNAGAEAEAGPVVYCSTNCGTVSSDAGFACYIREICGQTGGVSGFICCNPGGAFHVPCLVSHHLVRSARETGVEVGSEQIAPRDTGDEQLPLGPGLRTLAGVRPRAAAAGAGRREPRRARKQTPMGVAKLNPARLQDRRAAARQQSAARARVALLQVGHRRPASSLGHWPQLDNPLAPAPLASKSLRTELRTRPATRTALRSTSS